MATFDTIEDTQIPCLLNRKIDNGRFHLKQRLGKGGYSVVYLAIDLFARPGSSNPTHVAVKCLLNRRRHKISRETDLHRRAAASVPGIVKIFRTFHEGGLYFVVLEYCPYGDLFSAITENRLFLGRDHMIKNVFLQLLDTVAALHRIGIYHRDLKPENVLCATALRPSPHKGAMTMRIRLADFGLATTSERSESFGCGSYFYMTPECLAGTYSSALPAYSSRAADIWALGIILVNLICGRSPWKTAMLTDPSFHRYTRDARWLRQMLPLSVPAFHFLNRIFANHGNNLALADLRGQFAKIETFYMSPAELAVADKTARLVARKWMLKIPLDDIKQEDLRRMTHVNEVDEAQLFEDNVQGDDTSNSSTSAPPSTVDTDSARTSPLTSIDKIRMPGELTSAHTSSDSDFPITPESKPVHPAEGVPELPKGEQMGENWVLSTNEVHSFHKALSAAVDEFAVDPLVL